MNSSQTYYVHDIDHNDNHILEKEEEPFEFQYICEIPFPKKVPQQNSTQALLKNLPEVPYSQEKALQDQIQVMVANYQCKELSESEPNFEKEYYYEKNSYSMARPLKKRKIKF